MKTTRNLRLRLRLIEGALVLVLGLFTAGAAATRQLLLDVANKPTADISFSSSHWTGTLDAARLPASVTRLDGDNNLALPNGLSASGNLSTNGDCTIHGILRADDGYIQTDGEGSLTVYGLLTSGNVFEADVGMLAQGVLIVDDSAQLYYANGHRLTDASGRLYYSNGNTLADTDGTLQAAGWTIADADGFLHSGGQSYQGGAVTPTGFIVIKDATGASYRVPAVAAP